MKRIGIINYWWSPLDGHGASLTALALYKTVEMLDVNNKPILIKTISYGSERDAKCGRHYRFLEKKCNISDDNYKTKEEYYSLGKEFDIILLGSDQVFRIEWIPLHWFLNDVDDKVNKIAVSASFGTDSISADERSLAIAAKGLKKFNAISVREESAIDVFKKYFFDYSPDRIIDPVFWMDKEYYSSLADESNIHCKSKSVFLCVLDKTDKYEMIKKSLQFRGVQVYEDDGLITANDFLLLIRDADLIVTDSFHATCFSIIFNKKFAVIINELRGTARIDELKKRFALTNCFFTWDNLDYDIIVEQNYSNINKIIIEESKRGVNWIKNKIDNN